MLDSEKWKNDTLYKANYVLNALSHITVHGLDGTDGWDDDDIYHDVKLGCKQCIYSDEPGDCDYTEIFEDAVEVIGKLIKEYEYKAKMYHALEEDWKKIKEELKEQETANIYKCQNCGTWVLAENVVRCIDCKNGSLWSDENVIVCDKLSKTRNKNWFCADGEKKVK